MLRKGECDIEDIMKKLEDTRSVIPNAAPSRAMDVPAYKNDRTSSNDELERHPRLDAVNIKSERGKAEVSKLGCGASSLPTMTAVKDLENDKNVVVL